jgi:hypothetical protein
MGQYIHRPCGAADSGPPESIERALTAPGDIGNPVTGLPNCRLGQLSIATIHLKPGSNRPARTALKISLREYDPAPHTPFKYLFYNDFLRASPHCSRFFHPSIQRK